MADYGNSKNDYEYWFNKPSTYYTSSGTASTGYLVKTGAGLLTGIYISNIGATGTLKLWDNTAASTTVLIHTTTLATTGSIVLPHTIFNTGLYLTTTNTVLLTVFYK